MKKKTTINLLDVTLREGSYLVDHQLKPDDLTHIVDYLDHANIDYIELGHGSGLGAAKLGYPAGASDLEYFEAARQVVKKAKLGALVNPSWDTLPDFDEIHSLLDFARIATNVHETSYISRVVEKSKKYGLLTFVQLMRTPFLPPFRAAVAARKVEKMGADIIYIVDTMGSLTPKTVKEYVKAFRDHVGVPLGFHAHNNLGMAIANSLEAARAGCKWIDGSLLGVGRQAGNAQLEILALLLQREGYNVPVNIPLLLDTAESLVAPVFKKYKGIDPYDLWAAYWNLDLYPRWVYQQMALAVGLDTKSFIKELAQLKNFVTLDDDQVAAISKRFKIPYDKLLSVTKTAPDWIKAPD